MAAPLALSGSFLRRDRVLVLLENIPRMSVLPGWAAWPGSRLASSRVPWFTANNFFLPFSLLLYEVRYLGTWSFCRPEDKNLNP